MSVLDKAWGLPLWLLHSKSQVGTGCTYQSLGWAGIHLWDTAGPGRSLQDSSGPLTQPSNKGTFELCHLVKVGGGESNNDMDRKRNRKRS